MNRDPQKHCHFYCKECPLERSKNDDIIEPCKGHLVRRFIKECWWKCGCGKQCGNQVVQHGISCNLQVFMTPGGKGWGLRTLEDLPKGAFVCEYVGEILTNTELFERVLKCPSSEEHAYPVLLDADWGSEGVLKDEEALCLDATHYGNVARFINHSLPSSQAERFKHWRNLRGIMVLISMIMIIQARHLRAGMAASSAETSNTRADLDLQRIEDEHVGFRKPFTIFLPLLK